MSKQLQGASRVEERLLMLIAASEATGAWLDRPYAHADGVEPRGLHP